MAKRLRSAIGVGHARREDTARSRSRILLLREHLPPPARLPAPYRAGAIWSLVLAALAMVGTVAIPWLTGQAIDRDRRRRPRRAAAARRCDRRRRRASASASPSRAGSSPGRVSLGVEFDLRNLLYAHLQSLELGFFDGQQTGQLMSRATVDLQSVRFFLGYGLVFITQSALTILLAAVAMFALEPGARARCRSSPVPFVVLVAARYGRRSRPALQEVQQRIAELTADVEENVSGVRVVKAFARRAAPARALPRQRAAACSTSR